MFELQAIDPSSKARRGRVTTAHGVIDTPAFIPVGTQGSVKAVSPRELHELNAQIILGNTYHLFVRPGLDVIRHFGGLHRFMNWDGPILTDSGGFQIFSLAKLRKITEEGVHFQNHVDGTAAFISPEIAIEIQKTLGSDVAMVLDECPPWPCDYDYAAKSADMTARWAKRWAACAILPAFPIARRCAHLGTGHCRGRSGTFSLHGQESVPASLSRGLRERQFDQAHLALEVHSRAVIGEVLEAAAHAASRRTGATAKRRLSGRPSRRAASR